MNRLATILCLALALTQTSCSYLWMAAYRYQGRDPKPKKYIPVIRDFGGFNGREIWLYSPSQLPPLSRAASALRKLVPFEQPLLFPIRYRGAELYQLYEDWTVTVKGNDYTIPAGLVVDGASVPRPCWFFMPPDGLHRGAALFHDWGYILRGAFPDGPPMTKAQIDDAFYDLMVESGVSVKRAGIAYEGVHLGGFSAWASIESPTILPIDRHRMSAPYFLKPRTALSHIYAP